MQIVRDRKLQQARALSARPSDWSPTQIAAIRRMAARQVPAPQIIEEVGLDIKRATFWSRCRKLGISLHAGRKQHYGKDTSHPHSDTLVSTLSFRARSLP